MNTKSRRHLRKHRDLFCQVRQAFDLAELVETPQHQLSLMALKPQYSHFGIPKQDGSQRWIENPSFNLKYVQRRLNFHLQCCYYFRCTPAAYGFVMNAKGDPDPRNILTNARRHLHARYLFNADVEDFFHRISFEKVYQLFTGSQFSFEEPVALLLTQLCTHLGRLPMGGPTSPVLSNFACLDLDGELQALADWAGLCYTRFADDMSFSSQDPIEEDVRDKITEIVRHHGFEFNPNKVKLMGPDDPKFVTGLRLEGGEVGLPEGFLADLHHAIDKLGHAVEVQHYGGGSKAPLEDFQDQVEGMITFAAFILGEEDPVILDAEARLARALDPADEYSPVSWLNFAYYKQ